MEPRQRHAQVKRVFREALRWAPEHRAEVVAALAEDDGVRDEALSLLAHHREAEVAPAGGAGAAGGASGERTLAEVLRGERSGGVGGGGEGGGGGGGAAGWSTDRVIRTLEPIAEALASAAERGVVHGSVRADGIVLAGGTSDADLVAELVGSGGREIAGGELDAPRLDAAAAASAAPEQLSPALGPVGPWTDVYALALLCVELMLGRPAGGATVTAALARARDEAAQPAPRTVGLALPAPVEAVLARALAMRPMERYQDVRRFWTALRESVTASAAARPPALPSPSPSPPSSSPSPPLPSPAARAPSSHRRPPWPALVAGALALAAAAALAVQRCV